MESEEKTLVVLPYLNAHLGEFILYINANNIVDFYIMGKSEEFRRAFYNELSVESIKVIPYSSLLKNLFNKEYSAVVFHGIFYVKFIPLIILLQNAKIFLLSEAFNPKNYSWLSTTIKKAYCRIFNHSAGETHLIALGNKLVKAQYEILGLKFDFFEPSAYLPKLTGKYDKNLKMKDGIIRLAYIGQFIDRKNIRLLKSLINAEEWQKLNDKIELYIIGDGLNYKFETSSTNVKVITNLNREQVLLRLVNIDALLLPSFFDGWGAVVNEAISRGCALLLSKNVGASEMFLKRGENGYYISTNRYLDIIERIKEWVLNPSELQHMQTKSIEIFNNLHNPEVQYKFLK